MLTKRVRARKKKASRKTVARRGALTFAAATTATAMALTPITPAPPAEAQDIIDVICGIGVIRCDFLTAGLITGPIFQIGALIYSIPILSDLLPPGVIDIPGLGPIDVNAFIPGFLNKFSNQFALPDPGSIASGLLGMQATPLGSHNVVGIMDGALTTGQAITTIQDSINPVLGINFYNFILIRNPGRANGGMASRFDWLYNLTGIPGSAVSGNVASKQDTSEIPCAGGILCNYIPVKIDLALGYDSMDDFPISPLASVSILNSVMQSFLLTTYLGGQQIALQDAGNQNIYITVVPNESALLEPLRLAKKFQNILGFSIPIVSTIFADIPYAIASALEPAADILINVGYSDVDLTTYQRSFDDFNVNKQFLIDSTLTLDQYMTAVGAAFEAAISGLSGLFSGNLGMATVPAAQPSNEAVPQPANAAAAVGAAQLPQAQARNAAGPRPQTEDAGAADAATDGTDSSSVDDQTNDGEFNGRDNQAGNDESQNNQLGDNESGDLDNRVGNDETDEQNNGESDEQNNQTGNDESDDPDNQAGDGATGASRSDDSASGLGAGSGNSGADASNGGSGAVSGTRSGSGSESGGDSGGGSDSSSGKAAA